MTRGQQLLAAKVKHRGSAQVARDVELAESVVRAHAIGAHAPGRRARDKYVALGIAFADWGAKPKKDPAPTKEPKPRAVKVAKPATGAESLRESLETSKRELVVPKLDARDAARWLSVQLGALRGLVALAPPPAPTRCPTWPRLREGIEGWGRKDLPPGELAELRGLVGTFERSCLPHAAEIDRRAELAAVRTHADAWAAHPEIAARDRATVTTIKIAGARLLARLDARLSGAVLDLRWTTFRNATIRLFFRFKDCREAILAAAAEFDRALIEGAKRTPPRKDRSR